MSLIAAAMLGVGLGIRHAFEADHIAAVCTLVARDEARTPSAPRRASRLWMPEGVASAVRTGALWGVGHGAVIVVAGGGLVALGASVPTPIAAALDAAVAVMLVVLGVLAIRSALGGVEPAGGHPHGHRHLARPARARSPVLIGLLHGASGTAALTLLVTAQMHARVEAITFIVLFGAASVLGMTAAAGLLAWPLHKAVQRAPVFARRLRGASGFASIAAGIAIAWSVISPSALS